LTLLVVQVLLVLSIGAKYSWERHHCPAVWTRANQFDPSQPLRGRYLAVSLQATACGLSATDESRSFGIANAETDRWRVVPAVRNGELAPRIVGDTYPGPTEQLILAHDVPCTEAVLAGTSDFFVPEHAKSPFPLQKGQELWVLVTVPPSGPVRPVELAISDASGFHPLDLD
jgi:hypothetical protein